MQRIVSQHALVMKDGAYVRQPVHPPLAFDLPDTYNDPRCEYFRLDQGPKHCFHVRVAGPNWELHNDLGELVFEVPRDSAWLRLLVSAAHGNLLGDLPGTIDWINE